MIPSLTHIFIQIIFSKPNQMKGDFILYILILDNMQDNSTEKYLIKLKDAKEQINLDTIKQKLSQYPKYFLDSRSNTILVYDRTCVYIISKIQHKVTDLGKTYPIIQMIYNFHKNILVFLTSDGYLYGHFITGKTQFVVKKGIKNWLLFDWVYGLSQHVDLFITDHSGIKFFKVEEEKKNFKEMKAISGKYNSVLYESKSQVIVVFPVGDCRSVYTFIFDEQRHKNWFKGPQIPISIDNDVELVARVQKSKSLGLRNSTIHMELFTKKQNEEFYSELIRMNNKSYLIIYFGSQGKLKLFPIVEDSEKKEIVIKLPSDSIPVFNIIDNMLVINLTNEKITFIYDINLSGIQMLVSPFPIEHNTRKDINPYNGSFLGKRHILPEGIISKWVVNLSTIYFYLKNETFIFDFLHKRKKAKMQMLVWMRKNLLNFKQINLSKFWKLIFLKSSSNIYEERDVISLMELYANIFYTLSNDELTAKQPLLNTIIQCFRQANELQFKIPNQLQRLCLDLLLECKKYELLVFLCHNDIIKDDLQFTDILIKKGLKDKLQILLTLGIDMANRICKCQKLYQYLIMSQKIREAKRYVKGNYEFLETLSIINEAKNIEDVNVKRDYVRFAKAFICKKYPNTNEKYLEQAQNQVLKDD